MITPLGKVVLAIIVLSVAVAVTYDFSPAVGIFFLTLFVLAGLVKEEQ